MSASITPPEGIDPRKDSLIEYPSIFPIKVMGAMAVSYTHLTLPTTSRV